MLDPDLVRRAPKKQMMFLRNTEPFNYKVILVALRLLHQMCKSNYILHCQPDVWGDKICITFKCLPYLPGAPKKNFCPPTQENLDPPLFIMLIVCLLYGE